MSGYDDVYMRPEYAKAYTQETCQKKFLCIMPVPTLAESLAYYKPFIRREISYILVGIYSLVLWICFIVIYAQSKPPPYFVYAVAAIILTLATILCGLAAHEHPHRVLTAATIIFAMFSLVSSASMIHIIYGEHEICGKLYENDAALLALSNLADEQAGTGQAISSHVIGASVQQQISYYSMLCMGISYSTAWRNSHLAIVYFIGIISIMGSLTAIAVTLINFRDAEIWVKKHSVVLTHLIHVGEKGIQAALEKHGLHFHLPHKAHHNQ
jgi:hypothetical protein